jgi:hypothetical protein
VDIGRRPYTTTFKPFRDSDVTATLKWFPALRSAGTLPFPSKVNSLYWSTWFDFQQNAAIVEQTVGEVPGAKRSFNFAKSLPYAHDLPPCRPPEDFRLGERYDPDGPPALYNAEGWPLCCSNHFTSSGRLVLNSSATVVIPTAVIPGGTCNTATVRAEPTVDTWKVLFGTNGWVVVNCPAGTFTVTLISVDQPGAGVAVSTGIDCTSLNALGSLINPGDIVSTPFPHPSPYFLLLIPGFADTTWVISVAP